MKKFWIYTKIGICLIPTLILWAFSSFWEWWHFGPSQWLLDVGSNDGFSTKLMRRFISLPVDIKKREEAAKIKTMKERRNNYKY